MPKTHPPYTPEFRRQIVDLVRDGRDPADLARKFEPNAIAKRSICEAAASGIGRGAIRNWVMQADRQEGRREEKGNGLSTAERGELARLRCENKQFCLERDILSGAAPTRSWCMPC